VSGDEQGHTGEAPPAHLYTANPQSGAGNCTCGQAERHRRHFHEFMEAAGIGGPSGNPKRLCTCALPRESACHW
jgi:hypothetical protein